MNLSKDLGLVPETTLSVAGVTAYIQDLLELDSQLQQVWVTGEVSSSNEHRSGLFFTLSEPDRSAAIRCVVWRSTLKQLMQVPVPGEQLVALGNIRLYERRGEYQLTVWQTLPAGEGLQALRLRQLKERLQAEGLFDRQRKRPLPTHPQIIAVVTSPTAAAWGDIQRTLGQRYPGLTVLLSPATVQGEQAPPSIVQAIARVEADARAEVLLLARGGGATEDLSCFNDERVVRAIASCSRPVVTGIGHQRDESLADLVSDFCAHTPTAAAECIVPDYHRLVQEHRQRQQELIEAVFRRWEEERDRLTHLQQRLQRLPQTSRSLERARAHCRSLRERLLALDPQGVLQRGYAVVRKEGEILRSSRQAIAGDKLTIRLGEGTIEATITQVELDEQR